MISRKIEFFCFYDGWLSDFFLRAGCQIIFLVNLSKSQSISVIFTLSGVIEKFSPLFNNLIIAGLRGIFE